MARNYISDEFLNRTDCTHLMFIDADISFNPQDVLALLALDKDIIGMGYPKKCCSSGTKILTEDGVMTIAKIVREKYSGKVLSLDENGKSVWNTVVNHWCEPNKDKKWVGIKTKNSNKHDLIVTEDHKIACIEDLLNPHKIIYVEAKDSKGKYIVRKPELHYRNIKYPLYNKEQFSVLLGTVLGDGHIRKEGTFCMAHGPEQQEYLQYKISILGGANVTNGHTKFLEELIYLNRKKTLKNVIPLIDEISLAFMYMDDGNRRVSNYDYSENTNEKSWWVNSDETEWKRTENCPGDGWVRGRKVLKNRSTATIATHCYEYDDQLLLVEHFKNKFDLDCKLHKQYDKWQLFFDIENTEKLFNIIAPYVHESMNYKLSDDSALIEKYKIDTNWLDFGVDKILDVVEKSDDSKLYDIEVENSHCFFGNGFLVHNSIEWGQLHKAIQKNPNLPVEEYENLTGSIVFNAEPGTEKFLVSEPLKVMDLGTGFMMIKRSVFERFKEAYPELSYLPDHVGQQHFSGDREIWAFFDCIIDPVSRRYLSEDYTFTKRCRDIGISSWMCPWGNLTHHGNYAFKGNLAAMAQHLGSTS